MGHLRDLPKSTLSVDIEHDFEPEYQPLKGKEEIIAELQSRIMDEYNAARVGTVMEVLCEGEEPETGRCFGRTYADSPDIDGRVLFSAARSVSPGEFVMVRITGAEDGDLVGEMEENA